MPWYAQQEITTVPVFKERFQTLSAGFGSPRTSTTSLGPSKWSSLGFSQRPSSAFPGLLERQLRKTRGEALAEGGSGGATLARGAE